ncbi:xylulokinase [Mycobacterium sp. NPDC003449]
MTYLGIDLGTTSVKTLLLDDRGDVVARNSASYHTTVGVDGAAEQNPQDWVAALISCLEHVPAELRGAISAIAIDGHVPSLVLVDETGGPVRPAITWQDSRPSGTAALLGERLGDIAPLVGTALPWAASQLLPQLAWVARNDADARRARYAFAPKDYLNMFLTGVAGTDPWTAKGMCDTRTGEPVSSLLEAAGWPASICPSAGRPWESLGTVTEAAAAELGLPTGVVVATGWTDAMAAVLAVGAFESPGGFVLTGTSNIVGVSSTPSAEAPGLYNVPAGPSAPMPLLYGPTQSGGDALLWWARLLGVEVAELVGLAHQAAPDDLPTAIPYLRGERAPLWDDGLRGLVAGLSIGDDRPRVARAALSGVALAARHILDTAASAVGNELPVIDIGGVGITDAGWRSVWLTTLGRRVRLHNEPALSALGAAMLAALASGWDIEAISVLRQPPLVLEPDACQRSLADVAFERYQQASTAAVKWRTHE